MLLVAANVVGGDHLRNGISHAPPLAEWGDGGCVSTLGIAGEWLSAGFVDLDYSQ